MSDLNDIMFNSAQTEQIQPQTGQMQGLNNNRFNKQKAIAQALLGIKHPITNVIGAILSVSAARRESELAQQDKISARQEALADKLLNWGREDKVYARNRSDALADDKRKRDYEVEDNDLANAFSWSKMQQDYLNSLERLEREQAFNRATQTSSQEHDMEKLTKQNDFERKQLAFKGFLDRTADKRNAFARNLKNGLDLGLVGQEAQSYAYNPNQRVIGTPNTSFLGKLIGANKTRLAPPKELLKKYGE